MTSGVAIFELGSVRINAGVDVNGFTWYGNLDGLDGAASAEYSTVGTAGNRDGQIPAVGRLAPRTLTIDGQVIAADRDALKRARSKIAAVTNRMVKSAGVLRILDYDRKVQIQVKKRADLKFRIIGETIAEYQIALIAEDPRLESVELRREYLANTVERAIVNDGNYPAYAKVIVLPPAQNPITLSKRLKSSPLTYDLVQFNSALSSGKIVFDFEEHSIYLNGVRRADLIQVGVDWFMLDPGRNLLQEKHSSFEEDNNVDYIPVNCTIDVTGEWASDGAQSLVMKTSSAGQAGVYSPKQPASPGVMYSAVCRLAAEFYARVAYIQLVFFDGSFTQLGSIAAAPAQVMTIMGDGILSVVHGMSPPTTAYVAAAPVVIGVAVANERYYLDNVAIYEYPNMFTPDQASSEAATTGINATGCTLSRSSTWVKSGSWSLDAVSSAAASFMWIDFGWMPIRPETVYTFSVVIGPTATPRPCHLQVTYYDSVGNTLQIVNNGGIDSAFTEPTSGDVEKTLVSRSPKNAVYAIQYVVWHFVAGSGEHHYTDSRSFHKGEYIDKWTEGSVNWIRVEGASGSTPEVQYRDTYA